MPEQKRIIGDLHIHSKFSRATSSRIMPAYLDRWARIKGIELIGTGDCTHPKWLEILREELEEADNGFYALKEKVRQSFDSGPALLEAIPEPPLSDPVHFVLTGEISTIYKYKDKTRKVHHLVILPDFKAAAAFQLRLEQIGNIRSDGRPIFGMDSRDLLALLLDTDERSMLIPAHIWTPWFSVLGARSGFDSIEECYRDLTPYIMAVETGLSSNPPMNWALESLDNFSIVSNSDAHSLDKLGREATIFEMDLSWECFRDSFNIKKNSNKAKPAGIVGTIEFFPQEGKYHYDGHRNCGVCLGPEELAGAGEGSGCISICPVCEKPLTPGVMGRVLELADRAVDESAACPEHGRSNCRSYYSLIPLKEILSEILETGTASKKVEAAYSLLIKNAGSELSILMDMPIAQMEGLGSAAVCTKTLSEAIRRMRQGEVFISPGYDGEYGVIRTFGNKPKKKSIERTDKTVLAKQPGLKTTEKPELTVQTGSAKKTVFSLDVNQKNIVESKAKISLITAGPGTGKTAVLAEKISLMLRSGIDPASILALSFTVKAAGELKERVMQLLVAAQPTIAQPDLTQAAPTITTFHSLCASILREQHETAGLPRDFKIISESERKEILEEIAREENPGKKLSAQLKDLGNYIEEQKQYLLLPGDTLEDLKRVLPLALPDSLIPKKIITSEDTTDKDKQNKSAYLKYRDHLKSHGLIDFDGLISGTVRMLALKKGLLRNYQEKYKFVFVDEYQDLNFAQYIFIRLLAPDSSARYPSLWVIGDPNQAIYGFRGSDKAFIDRFQMDYPDAALFELRKSFRCSQSIINAAARLTNADLEGVAEGYSIDEPSSTNPAAASKPVSLFRQQYSTEKSEAEGIARTIASLLGGTSFFAMDSGAARGGSGDISGNISSEDFAILTRTASLAEPIIKALKNHGIPFELTDSEPFWEQEPCNHILAFLYSNSSKTQSVEDEIISAFETLREQGKLPKRKKNIIPEPVIHLISLGKIFGSIEALLDGLAGCRDAGAVGISGAGISRGVNIMTIHASKGLEFDYVFVPALEDGVLPFTFYNKNEDENSENNIEEERRLLYVAMTRARRGLWLSYCASRFYMGRALKSPVSRFMHDLENLVPLQVQPQGKSIKKTSKQDSSQMTLF